MAKMGSKALSTELAKLASDVHSMSNDGVPITNEQALAKLIWRTALGWVELVKDDEGKLKQKLHPPASWAMQYLYERLEGKAPIAAPDNSSGMRASEKVSKLAKDRVNQLAVAAAGPPEKK